MDLILLSLLITIIIWLFNLESNPGLGNVWLRPDPDGNVIIAWRSLSSLLLEPFKNARLWYPKYWDINFYTLFALVYILTRIINYFKNF